MANTTIYPYGQNGNLPVGTVIEADPIFTNSPAYNITASDITNWNSKTSNTGTVTSVKVGTTSYSPSSGVVSIPAYPSVPVTDVTVGGISVLSSGTAAIPSIPDAVEANPTVPSGTTPTSLTGLKVGSDYYGVSGGNGGEANVIEAITFNGTPATITNKTAAITATIPSEVTEATVSGWGFTKNTGTYSKPSGGIPATDLASTVQTSLGKADTALQSYTETDPTVPSWAKASTKPTYTASEVGALPLAGGTMDSGAEIYLPGSSSLSETKVTRDGVSVSPNANSFSTVTSYKHGSILYSPNGMNLNTISLPAATGTIALTSDIPSAVTESTVSGWGFTKNNGTITGITMNGASKGTSGVVNLGTVLTSHQDISGKANLSGATFTGTVTGTSSGNTAQFRNVTISSSEPTSSQGSNGDIWIVI